MNYHCEVNKKQTWFILYMTEKCKMFNITIFIIKNREHKALFKE